MIKKYDVLPKAPYFYYSDNEEISVGFNQEHFPIKSKIKGCIEALERLLSASDVDIKLYNDKVNYNKTLELEQSTLEEYATKPLTKKESGYVYLYKSGEHYKIGRSKSPTARRVKYITENPNKIDVLLEVKVNNYKEQEAELLNLYKNKKHRGEWFCLNAKDVKKIQTLLNNNKANE